MTGAPLLCGDEGAVMEVLKGHSAALDVIEDARRGCADPDLFYARLRATVLIGTEERLRGFMRTLQKTIEAQR